jgi:hypothetical protein
MALWTARCRENLACAIGWALNNCNNLKNNSSDDDSSKLVYECNFRFQSFIMGSHFGWQFCLDNSMSIHFHIITFQFVTCNCSNANSFGERLRKWIWPSYVCNIMFAIVVIFITSLLINPVTLYLYTKPSTCIHLLTK